MNNGSRNIANLSPEEKRALLARLLREKANATKDWSPLSHGQKALWFLYRLAPESVAYNLLYSARVHAALDVAALQRAVQVLVKRYPILTATYAMHDGEPSMRLQPNLAVPIEVVEAANWSEEELKQRVYEEGHRPFNLEQGPVLRIKLFTLSAKDAVLALTVHHIAVDFWALDILVEELGLLYIAEISGEPIQWPGGELREENYQFRDYVKWQTEMLQGPEGERLWDYWQHELSGELPMLNLPLDHPRPPVQTYNGATYKFPIRDDVSRRLREIANAQRTTPYTVLLAAFQLLLYRYSHQEDILLGTTALGRSRSELERVIGYLANPVVLRANFSGNPTFKDFLVRARQGIIGALEHQDFPFPLLVERLQPRRDPAYSPLFQVLFIWDKMRAYDEQAGDPFGSRGQPQGLPLQLEPFVYGQLGAPFDLSLTIFEIGQSLAADFHYNVDLFEAETIERMGAHFQTLLAGIATNPDQHILELPLLTQQELHQVLVAWNDTQRDYPQQATLHQLIEQQVQRTPGAIAVTFEGVALTYTELNRRANQLAHNLRAAGIGPEKRVGVCMERSLEMVVGLLAVLKAGAAYVPLDPGYPQERLAYMLEDAQVPVLLTQTALLEHLPPHTAETICLDTFWESERSEAETNPASGVQPDNIAYMIYTSGSTGKPKGVMNTHRGIVNRLHWMQQQYGLTEQDHVLQKTPFSFDVSIWEFFWPLLSGARLVVARPGGHQDTAYLASLIADQRITTLHFVPSMLQAFLLEPNLERCRRLKRVICSGEALPFDLQERFFARFPNVELHNLYGPTEAAIDVTYWVCRPGQAVTIGRPIANTQLYILDEARQPVPIGVAGELYIGGVGVARGYFNRPALTAEKFVADPFSKHPDARLFKTGDLARYRPDGAIEFLGRVDYQVKIRGFRIELGEIEAVLTQHPGIKEAVVMAREDTPGNKRLVAYIVPSLQEQTGGPLAVQLTPQQAGLAVEELRLFLKDRLPYYMIPAAFLFLSSLPLTPNGKVDRKSLPAPDATRPELESAFVAPRTPLEEQLVAIWSSVLGLDKVGIHDNFFDLGGASIQSLEIIAKAGEAGIPLALEMLFEFQTIAELASAIERKQLEDAITISSAGTDVARSSDRIEGVTNLSEPATTPATGTDVACPPAPTERGNTVIESIGIYLPPKIVTTEEILAGCVKPIRFPMARLTGIKTRRIAGETEFSIDLAKKAVAECLANSKYNPEDIDMLICGNISRCNMPGLKFSFEPGTAIQLQRYFGFKNAIVYDLDNACTGLFTAVYIVDAFLKAGLIRRAMVVSGEYISHLIITAQKELESFMDSRLPCLTVGDAGAAMILESAPDKRVGFHDFEMYTLGRYSEDCIGKATDREHGGGIMYTDAVRVSAVNMTQAVAHAANILKRSGWPSEAFQHIIIHQTSGTTIRDAARAINSYFGTEVCKQENVIYNIEDRANTATTTHIVAIMDHIRSGRIKSGDNAVLGITGSGATIGAALYTFDDLPDRIRRREAGEYTPLKVVAEPRQPVPLTPANRRIRVASIGTVAQGSQAERGGMQALSLLQGAAQNCLAASSYQRNDLDLLINAGVYRDEFLCEPAVASLLAGKMQLNDDIKSPLDKKTFALDIFNGAIGTLNACHAAIGMIRAGKASNALITAAEIENNRQHRPDVLYGLEEVGSALILDQSPDGITGFGNFVFKYFTEYIDALVTHTEIFNGKTVLRVERDPRIERYYVQCIQEAVQELLSLEHLDLAQIKVVLPPQISTEFIGRLSDALSIDRSKLVDVQAQRDLFTSSLAYTLQHVRQHKLVQPGDIGLIISVGSGIQVGCATYYF
jgi:amino acid adenylation domain-containing protein